MKRLLALIVLVVLVPGVALAFDVTRPAERIAILRPAEVFDGDESLVQDAIIRGIAEGLRARGFDAWESDLTYVDARDAERVDADYFVEVAGDSGSAEYGGVGIDGIHGHVTLGLVVSRVAADVRLYDAETMEVVAEESLAKRTRSVMPTGVGLGGRRSSVFAWVALPVLQRVQIRRTAGGIAREAAVRLAEVLRAD